MSMSRAKRRRAPSRDDVSQNSGVADRINVSIKLRLNNTKVQVHWLTTIRTIRYPRKESSRIPGP